MEIQVGQTAKVREGLISPTTGKAVDYSTLATGGGIAYGTTVRVKVIDWIMAQVACLDGNQEVRVTELPIWALEPA